MSQANLRLAPDPTRIAAPEDLSRSPLAVRGLTVSYRDKPVLFSVDATIQPGQLTAIIGPNGAGKSTLLKAALGLIPKVSGTVTHYGRPLQKRRDRIAYVPQRASVDWEFPTRAIDVVMQGLHRELGLLSPVRAHHRSFARACLERVGMGEFETRQIGQLSGGQQQRVFLARALAQSADLYVLDEPFAGVDAATEHAIVGVLKSLRDDGKTVLAVHHDLSTVEAYFDRVLILNVRKIAEGPVADAFTTDALSEAYGGRLASAQVTEMAL